ncbi:hypothetical protein UlMin_028427 [Ulmus minor]
MEVKSYEGRQSWKEKANVEDYQALENYNNIDTEDEEASGFNAGESGSGERKKKSVALPGRRGGCGGGGVSGSPPSCQAERCGVDLTEAKRYHRRHKVCEFHAKAPIVVVAGLRQRFCQQCSRFHELSEFDEAKRSCRRRLAGHNERRRKSSADGENSGGRSSKESQGREVDDQMRGKFPINSSQGNSAYKQYHIY